MFLGIFETFVSLLMLYNYGASNVSYNNHFYYTTSRYSTSIRPQPPQYLGYTKCNNHSGTSVTFDFDADNYDMIYDEDSTSYVESNYRFFSQVNENFVTIGSYSFRLEYNADIDSFRVKSRYIFDDVYNLKINISYSSYDNDVNGNLFLYLKNNYYSDITEYYTSWVAGSPDNYFARHNSSISLTIETIPVDQEAWSGTWDDGHSEGYTEGYRNGQADGYATGYQDALEQGSTASVIFSGILSIALVPVNFFLGILNFEVFGINIGAFVSALLTIAIIIIIIRIIFSGGNGKGD